MSDDLKNIKAGSENYTKKTLLKITKGVFLVGFAFMIATISTFYFLGYRAVLVDGWSMGHIIPYRSVMITDTNVSPDEIKLGDAIMYQRLSANDPITHKLVEVRNSQDQIIANFRYNNEAWESDGGYVEEYVYFGTTVLAWYSGESFNSDSMFITHSVQPANGDYTEIIEQPNPDVEFSYDEIRGVAQMHFYRLGLFIYFVRDNIILVIGTIVVIFILISAVKKDLANN